MRVVDMWSCGALGEEGWFETRVGHVLRGLPRWLAKVRGEFMRWDG